MPRDKSFASPFETPGLLDQDDVSAGSGSFFQQFFDMTTAMDPPQRGSFLETPPPEAPRIEEAHAVSHLCFITPQILDDCVHFLR